MTHRQRIKDIIAGRAPDRCAFWLGNPHPDTWPILHAYFGTRTEEALRIKLGDDFRWICPQWSPSVFADPRSRRPEALMSLTPKQSHGDAGPLANCQTVADLDAFDWPRPDHLRFDELTDQFMAQGCYRASGFWTCFFHNVMDLFGMEQYLVNMYESPDLVHAVTDRVCQYYFDANEQLYAHCGHAFEAFFFGNDFGTQLDLICSPQQFDQFILPWFRRFTEQAHAHGKQVILHSCGAIHRVIGRLIDAGVDCLHPLQSLARNMDAATLSRDFRGKIAFLGGIDTQKLLIEASPSQVKEEVRRVKQELGSRLIVSPSHEAILPNIPPANVAAMAEAATE